MERARATPSSLPPKRRLPAREAYDAWAAHYDHDGNPLIAVDDGVFDALIGEVRGLDVLDVGCGTARVSAKLAARGARVVGIDQSQAMLAHAAHKLVGLPVELRAHDITTPLPFAERTFDRVVCALVVEHVEDLTALLREMRRVCRPGGVIVLTDMHPAMRLKGTQANFTDPATGTDVLPPSVPRQVSDYVMAALGAGLSILEMCEVAPTEELAARVPRARKYVGWPMLLGLVLAR